MMNKLQRFALVLLCTMILTSAGSSQILTHYKSHALIFPKSGDGYAATILRVERDSLILFTNTITTIAKKDVSKIILHKTNEASRGFVIGSILGMYGMNYLPGTANGQPGGFLWSDIYGSRFSTTSYSGSGSSLSVIGIAFLGVLTGGGIGYLLDYQHESETEATYLFGGTQELLDEEWANFQAAVEH